MERGPRAISVRSRVQAPLLLQNETPEEPRNHADLGGCCVGYGRFVADELCPFIAENEVDRNPAAQVLLVRTSDYDSVGTRYVLGMTDIAITRLLTADEAARSCRYPNGSSKRGGSPRRAYSHQSLASTRGIARLTLLLDQRADPRSLRRRTRARPDGPPSTEGRRARERDLHLRPRRVPGTLPSSRRR